MSPLAGRGCPVTRTWSRGQVFASTGTFCGNVTLQTAPRHGPARAPEHPARRPAAPREERFHLMCQRTTRRGCG
ncbi:hypothetical protein ACR6C2_00865 [Streptomyces sp. INA 01156]